MPAKDTMAGHTSEKQRWPACVVALLLLANAPGQGAAAAVTVADDTLARGAWQLLSQKCLACHGGDGKKFKGGLDLRTRQNAIKGGERGPALVPGDPAKSLMHTAVTRIDDDLSMPPKEKDKLAVEEVELIRKRLESTHWKRRLPTVAMLSQTAIGEYYLRPVDF